MRFVKSQKRAMAIPGGTIRRALLFFAYLLRGAGAELVFGNW
jgi:hypothetical protein